jgi:hypothetical protein
MGNSYILRKKKSSLLDLKDGATALNYGVGAKTVYFVDCNCGSDGNGGTSWDDALKTLTKAMELSHADIASGAYGWAARNAIYVRADQTKDADGEDFTKLAQKTDIIGVGSVDHLMGARIIGNHVIGAGAYMGCRFINMIFKCPAAGGDIFTVPDKTSGLSFENCTFDATSTAAAGGAIIATAVDCLTIKNCLFRGQFADAVIEIGAGESNSLLIENNIIEGAEVGIEVSSTATCAARAGRILNNTINTTKECVKDASGKFYVHNNTVVTGNAKGAAGAGAIVAGAKMMLQNHAATSDATGLIIPANASL